MIISTTPLSVAAEPGKSAIYGVSYDWSNFEGDVLNLTGVDTNAVNKDLSEASKFAGFNLETDQVLSGQSQFFIESWHEEGIFTIVGNDGNSHSVTKEMTELSIRHGSLADIGFIADWIDNNESIDAWFNANDETLFVLDALYAEYVDENMVIRGGDLAISGGLESNRSLEFRIDINAGNESIAPRASASADFSFQFPSVNSSLRLYDISDEENNQTSVFTVEEINAIFVTSDWDPIIPNLNAATGMCDAILSTMTITDAREEVVDFTRAYYTYAQGVIGANGSVDITDVSELNMAGTTIAVQSGTTSDLYAAENLAAATIQAYADWSSVMAAVADGTAQYAIGDAPVVALQGTLLTTFSPENFGIAVRDEADNELEDALNVAITALVADGEEAAIFDAWFPGDPNTLVDTSTASTATAYPTPTEGSTLTMILESGSLKFCSDTTYPPFESIDANGNAVGFGVDVGNAIVNELTNHYSGNLIYIENSNDSLIFDEEDSEIGLITGTYETSTGYSLGLSISDIPTEDIGINLDTFNVQITDKIPSSGYISGYMYDEYDLPEDADEWDCPPLKSTEQISIDSSDEYVSVECGIFLPVPAGMIALLTTSMGSAFEGGLEQLSTTLSNQIESWLSEVGLNDQSSGEFTCNNGEIIPGNWVNDGMEDCVDGSDENDSDQTGESTFTCDDGEIIPADWVNDGEEDCADGSDEDESVTSDEKLVRMAEALEKSNIQKTGEAFIDRFNILIEDNVPSTPIIDIENLCGIMFHDGSGVIGFGVINNGRIILGPSVLDAKKDTIQLNVKYMDGDDARNAKSGTSDRNAISDLAPQSRHDLTDLYEMLELEYIENVVEEEKSGALPGMGLIATTSLLVASVLFASRREEL